MSQMRGRNNVVCKQKEIKRIEMGSNYNHE